MKISIWETGGIAPRILDLGIRWSSHLYASVALRPTNQPRNTLHTMLENLQSRSGRGGYKIPNPARDWTPDVQPIASIEESDLNDSARLQNRLGRRGPRNKK